MKVKECGAGAFTEIGTKNEDQDWYWYKRNAKNAEIQAKRDAQRQAYDHIHGQGAYDAKVHAKTVELQKIFKTLTNKWRWLDISKEDLRTEHENEILSRECWRFGTVWWSKN